MSETVHKLCSDGAKQEDNSSTEELSFKEYGHDEEDSKSFQEEFIEGKNIWLREDFILPKSLKSEVVNPLSVDVKLEDNFIKEESSFSECRYDEEDSKSFQEHFIEGENIWKREDFILPECCDSPCDEMQLNEIEFPEHENGETIKETNVNNLHQCENILTSGSVLGDGLECNLYNINLKEKNLRCNFETGQKKRFGAHVDDEVVVAKKEPLGNHHEQSHNELKIYECHLCEYTATQMSHLKSHIEGVHLKLKNHKCRLCEYASNRKSHLKSHIKGVHLKLKDHKCHTCNYAALSKCALETHISSVHLKVKNHKCPMCEFTAVSNSKLQGHIDCVHLKLRNHKCHMCEYTTTRKSTLEVHINGVHLKLKNHKCHTCNYAALSKCALETHISSVHLKMKNHKCHMCEFTAVSNSKLQVHINCVHLKLRNHKCHMCEYTTTRKNTLQVHINGVHLKLKNHKCHMCAFSTSQKGLLTTHFKRIHLKSNPNCQVSDIKNASTEFSLIIVDLNVE